MVVPVGDQVASERPHGVGAQTAPTPVGVEEDIDRRVSVVGLLLLEVLDEAGHRVVDQHDEASLAAAAEELAPSSREIPPSPPSRHLRAPEDADERRHVVSLRRAQHDSLPARDRIGGHAPNVAPRPGPCGTGMHPFTASNRSSVPSNRPRVARPHGGPGLSAAAACSAAAIPTGPSKEEAR